MTARSPNSHQRRDIEAKLALLHLSGMGPARSRWLLSTTGAEEVVARLGAGRTPVDLDQAPPGVRSEDLAKWSAEVAKIDPPALYKAQIDEGWTVLSPHDDAWPFADDPEPPLLLFCAGNVDLLSVRARRRRSSVLDGAQRLGVLSLIVWGSTWPEPG